jgi:hypothetical protein
LTEHEPVFDCKVLAFDVAELAERAEQYLEQVGIESGREIAQSRRPWTLLPARRKRP